MTIISMLFASFDAHANDTVRTTIPIHKIEAPFSKLVIRDDVKIVLIEDASGQISVEGNMKQASMLRFEVKNGVLDVSSVRSGKKRLTLFIPVQKLKEVVVKGNSKVSTIGVLNSPTIKVLIEGDCMVNIVAWGKITVERGRDHDFDYLLKQEINIKGAMADKSAKK